MKSYYFPRTDKAELLLNNIKTEDPMNMMLFKQRRSGKTLFLKKDVMDLADKHNVFCFYFSFLEIKNGDRITEDFINDFLISLKNGFSLNKKMFSEFKNFFHLIKEFSFGVSIGDEKVFNFELFLDTLRKQTNLVKIKHLFSYFKKCFPDKKLLLLLDEFQELSNQQNLDFIKELRTAIDVNSDFVKVIFTGSSYNKLMSFFNDYNQPFYNFGFNLYLEDFDINFIKHLLSVFHERTKRLDLTEDYLFEWFNKTGKSPYYVSETLKVLENNPQAKFETEINRILSFDKDLINKELIHLNFWNGLNEIEKFLILYIIKVNGRLTTQFAIKSLQHYLKKLDVGQDLTEKQLKNKISYFSKKMLSTEKISKVLNEYRIVDLKLKEWIVKNPMFDEVDF